MEIKYFTRRQFDRQDKYVADVDLASSIRKITGKKVLSDTAMQGLKELGHTFKQVREVTIIK